MLNRWIGISICLLSSALLIPRSATFGWQDDAKQSPSATTVWIEHKELHESSGLARSRRNDKLLWTHNDSGDEPRLFAFDYEGRIHAIVDVKDAKAIDWEDMCSFTRDGRAYLAIGDVGNNAFARKHVTIYVIEEPKVDLIPTDASGKQAKADKSKADVICEIKVKYPDGPLNCEAIAYDPWHGQFLLASKEQFRSQLFSVNVDLTDKKQEREAKYLATVPAMLVTGASISDDGRRLVLGTYGPTCLLHRNTDTPSASAHWVTDQADKVELLAAPPRKQGESICFDKSGTKLLMTSEGQPMPLITSDCKP